MGYFNIFYKITRIIDMLTRKRNRKAIMVILIIIAIVFIYHNKVNAQEDDLVYNQSFYTLRMRVSSNGVVQSGTITTSSSTTYHHCLVIPVKEGFVYKGKCTTAFPSSAPGLYVTFCSDLDEFQTQLDSHIVSETNSGYFSSTALSYIGLYNALNGFEITAINDGFLIIGDFVDSNSYSLNNYGFSCVTNYNGESNLNTINQDLLRIEELLKDYLYGDVDAYSLSFNSVQNLAAPWENSNFITASGYNTLYFKVRKGYNYKITFNTNYTSDPLAWAFRYGICDSIPSTSNRTNTFNLWSAIDYATSIEYNSNDDCYFYITYLVTQFNSFNVTSNYNEGQELGLYGGLTDINNQTRQQGEQTRETITSTDYNSEDVNINTDSISNIDSGQTEGLFTTIFNNFNSAITGGVNEIEIPMPNGAGNITLRSDIVSSHIGNLSALISAFWYFIFGFYAFKFVNNLLHNIKDGSILDGFKNNNEVITQDML